MSHWDERYASSERIWSGEPNQALVAEASDLPVGRALDVGCGEGADSIWLASRGWDVTAIDVSTVAIGRAERAAQQAGTGSITFIVAGLEDLPIEPRYDLVVAMYPALRKSPDRAVERRLLGLVAPGGTLLAVHHANFMQHAEPHGDGDGDGDDQARFDPADYVSVRDIADAVGAVDALDARWTVAVHEIRERSVSGGAGARHRDDEVLRASRAGA